LDLQYGEFRTGFNNDKEDTRMVIWGLQYILENYVIRQWTEEDVERADVFYRYAAASTDLLGLDALHKQHKQLEQQQN
jgi:hypothetical protein